MGLNLKKIKEGIAAQLNTRDQGKTFSTVMRNTTPTPAVQRPAVSFNQPTQQVSFQKPSTTPQFTATPTVMGNKQIVSSALRLYKANSTRGCS